MRKALAVNINRKSFSLFVGMFYVKLNCKLLKTKQQTYTID